MRQSALEQGKGKLDEPEEKSEQRLTEKKALKQQPFAVHSISPEQEEEQGRRVENMIPNYLTLLGD